MQLRFRGKATQGGGSPTLFDTDRSTYVVQGWKVTGRHDAVEIPQRLLAHLDPGTYLGGRLEVTGRGTFIVAGEPVTDADALAQLDVPEHETCVEAPKEKEVWFDGLPAR